VRAKDFTEGGAFWQVGVPEVSDRPTVTAARASMDKGLKNQRQGI
jgi:TPP-dependent trihydroxycyclohexane-1,2-dione (THcHDO) dehydratase